MNCWEQCETPGVGRGVPLIHALLGASENMTFLRLGHRLTGEILRPARDLVDGGPSREMHQGDHRSTGLGLSHLG